jgi:hypothetical protein
MAARVHELGRSAGNAAALRGHPIVGSAAQFAGGVGLAAARVAHFVTVFWQ